MRQVLIIFMLIIINYGKDKPAANAKGFVMNTTETCFSRSNFDRVYCFVEIKITEGDMGFYQFEHFELYLSGSDEIRIKKDGFSVAIINRDKGIFSLAKILEDNNRLRRKAYEIFCRILALGEEKGR